MNTTTTQNSDKLAKGFFGEGYDVSTMTVDVRNELHNTETRMTVNGENKTVAADEVDRVAAVLCGMSDCDCHCVPLVGTSVIDIDGDAWEIV